MTVTELGAILEANDVPHAYYSLRGMAAGDCYVLEEKANVWNIYYSERGSRYDERSYPDENSACCAIFTLLAEMMLSSGHQAIDIKRIAR